MTHLSPLTTFSSPRNFAHYFMENRELEVPKNQPLSILGIDSIIPDLSVLRSDNIAKKALQVMDWITSCIGKKISFIPLTTGILNVDTDKDLTIIYSGRVKLRTEISQIDLPLKLFFRVMHICEVSATHFQPDQALLLLGSKSKPALPDCLNKAAPEGYKVLIDVDGYFERINVRLAKDNTPGIFLSHDKGFSIRLCDSRYSFKTAEEFLNKLDSDLELKIPINQELIIVDKSIRVLNKAYEVTWQGLLPKPIMILNQLVKVTGKTISIEGDVECEVYIFRLTLRSKREFTIKLDNINPYIVKVEELALDMIKFNRVSVKIAPDQALFLADISHEELRPFMTGDSELFIKRFTSYACRWNPHGYCIKLNAYAFSASLFHLNTEKREIESLELISSNGFEIELERASGVQLILSFLQNSSPVLTESLKEADPQAFIFILFRVISYLTTGDFRRFMTDQLPTYLKKETIENILKLVKEDEKLEEAILVIANDPELEDKYEEIQNLTPEEFDALDRESLPTEIRLIINKITPILYDELKGGVFLQDTMQTVLRILKGETESAAAPT